MENMNERIVNPKCSVCGKDLKLKFVIPSRCGKMSSWENMNVQMLSSVCDDCTKKKKEISKIRRIHLAAVICSVVLMIVTGLFYIKNKTIDYMSLNVFFCFALICTQLSNIASVKRALLNTSDDNKKKRISKMYNFTKVILCCGLLYCLFCIICRDFINQNKSSLIFLPNIILPLINLWEIKKLESFEKEEV